MITNIPGAGTGEIIAELARLDAEPGVGFIDSYALDLQRELDTRDNAAEPANPVWGMPATD